MDDALNSPMVELHNLTVSYNRHPALHHVSGAFKKGSLTAVLGPNGAGKSTLLKSVLGLLPYEGSITLACPRTHIAYLPQQLDIDRSFPISVLDCVQQGSLQTVGLFGGLSQAQTRQALSALHSVGIAELAQRPISTLSTGQFQRVLFARLMLQDADLILLDEPFAAVDSRTTTDLMAIVASWHAAGRTVIAVLHDEALALSEFAQTLLLSKKLVAWGNASDVLTPANLQLAQSMTHGWEPEAEHCNLTGLQKLNRAAA